MDTYVVLLTFGSQGAHAEAEVVTDALLVFFGSHGPQAVEEDSTKELEEPFLPPKGSWG